jgi:hypothetical protein
VAAMMDWISAADVGLSIKTSEYPEMPISRR